MRKTTNDEHEIRAWAKRRNAHPVQIAPLVHDSEPAKLGFVFGDPPEARDELQPISWAQFFALFRLMDLVLAHDGDSEYELLRVNPDVPDHLHPRGLQS